MTSTITVTHEDRRRLGTMLQSAQALGHGAARVPARPGSRSGTCAGSGPDGGAARPGDDELDRGTPRPGYRGDRDLHDRLPGARRCRPGTHLRTGSYRQGGSRLPRRRYRRSQGALRAGGTFGWRASATSRRTPETTTCSSARGQFQSLFDHHNKERNQCVFTSARRTVRLSEEWHEYLHARLAFALARFDHRILDITASLTDVNGPKGGVDKQCRLVVRLRPRGKVTIEQSASDLVAAIALAADRVSYAVSRALKRRRDARAKRRRIERAALAGA